MKIKLLLNLFLLIVPAIVYASPMLPDSVIEHFDGTITWGGNVSEMSGRIEFTLEFQIDVPAYEYLDWVWWEFEMASFDNKFKMVGGYFTNEEAVHPGFPPHGPDFLSWDGEWDVGGTFSEQITDFQLQGASADSSSFYAPQGIWDLKTNANFLPKSMWFPINEDFYTNGVHYELQFYFSPVPEPATMLLLGTGLAGLAAFRKKFKKR